AAAARLAAETVGDDAALARTAYRHAGDLESHTRIRRGRRWRRRTIGRTEKARGDPVGANILDRTAIHRERCVEAADAVLAGIRDRRVGDGQPEVRLGGGTVRTAVERDPAARVIDQRVPDVAGTAVSGRVAGDDQAAPVAWRWNANGDEDRGTRNGLRIRGLNRRRGRVRVVFQARENCALARRRPAGGAGARGGYRPTVDGDRSAKRFDDVAGTNQEVSSLERQGAVQQVSEGMRRCRIARRDPRQVAGGLAVEHDGIQAVAATDVATNVPGEALGRACGG